MRYVIFFLSMLLTSLQTMSQGVAPGGVGGYIIWGVANDSPTQGFTVEIGNGSTIIDAAKCSEKLPNLNYHPVTPLKNFANGLHLHLNGVELNQMTIIAAYSPSDSLGEQCFWYLEKNAHCGLVATTYRTVDIEESGFMNFFGGRKDMPSIQTFLQFKQPDTFFTVRHSLVFGKTPVLPDLPIHDFTGFLAELIVYDRVLAPQEREQVETYLAIKYGIPLFEGGTSHWRNSTGTTLLVQTPDSTYSKRTIAIGRDDATGLHQKQSTSSFEPGLLAIASSNIANDNASNTASIANNNTFVFLADDGMPATLGNWTKGKPHLISRTWQIKPVGDVEGLSTELRLNSQMTNGRLKEGETWWLAIDRSGKGRFEPNYTEYYRASEFTNSKIAVFSNLVWDKDKSGSDVIAFGIGAEQPSDWDKEMGPSNLTDSNFQFVEVYPNPAPNGQFQLAVALKESDILDIHITDVQGKMLVTKQMEGHSYYFESIQLNASPGTYFVNLHTGNSHKSFPLIIE